MKERYQILYRGGSGELIEKKSRFIATLRPVHTEEEAIGFIEEMKKNYWDASHNCYAWVLGSTGQQQRCSDDGEPSQTAGRPMLDVLLGAQICDVCVVVTRYFGGTLLETGGLVRAYQGAVQEGLKACQVVTKQLGRKYLITTDYNGIGKIQYLLAEQRITVLNTDYTDRVVVMALVPVAEADRLVKNVTEVTSGRAGIEAAGDVYYGMLGKEVLLFEE